MLPKKSRFFYRLNALLKKLSSYSFPHLLPFLQNRSSIGENIPISLKLGITAIAVDDIEANITEVSKIFLLPYLSPM
jgi:hypothetical protein